MKNRIAEFLDEALDERYERVYIRGADDLAWGVPCQLEAYESEFDREAYEEGWLDSLIQENLS